MLSHFTKIGDVTCSISKECDFRLTANKEFQTPFFAKQDYLLVAGFQNQAKLSFLV